MEIRCANCGQPALKGDNVCWHCGDPLPGYEEEALEEVRVKEGWGPSTSSTSIIVYAGITVAVFAALILVMIALGERPQVQVSIGTRPADEWELVTNADQSLTTHLPQEWSWFDGSLVEHSDQLRSLIAEESSFLRGTHPLGGGVDDLEFDFLAISPKRGSESTPVFMIVATSEKLNRLSYNDAAIYLDEGDFVISELIFNDNFERSHLTIVTQTELEPDGATLRCRQQFIKGEESAMLLALCAPSNLYTSQQTLFEEIWNNFQRLS
jgi:hypothetical protein